MSRRRRRGPRGAAWALRRRPRRCPTGESPRAPRGGAVLGAEAFDEQLVVTGKRDDKFFCYIAGLPVPPDGVVSVLLPTCSARQRPLRTEMRNVRGRARASVRRRHVRRALSQRVPRRRGGRPVGRGAGRRLALR